MYLVFTSMPGESYCRQLRSWLLPLHDVFRALINSHFCWSWGEVHHGSYRVIIFTWQSVKVDVWIICQSLQIIIFYLTVSESWRLNNLPKLAIKNKNQKICWLFICIRALGWNSKKWYYMLNYAQKAMRWNVIQIDHFYIYLLFFLNALIIYIYIFIFNKKKLIFFIQYYSLLPYIWLLYTFCSRLIFYWNMLGQFQQQYLRVCFSELLESAMTNFTHAAEIFHRNYTSINVTDIRYALSECRLHGCGSQSWLCPHYQSWLTRWCPHHQSWLTCWCPHCQSWLTHWCPHYQSWLTPLT